MDYACCLVKLVKNLLLFCVNNYFELSAAVHHRYILGLIDYV